MPLNHPDPERHASRLREDDAPVLRPLDHDVEADEPARPTRELADTDAAPERGAAVTDARAAEHNERYAG